VNLASDAADDFVRLAVITLSEEWNVWEVCGID
jgi:hypothetical protein